MAAWVIGAATRLIARADIPIASEATPYAPGDRYCVRMRTPTMVPSAVRVWPPTTQDSSANCRLTRAPRALDPDLCGGSVGRDLPPWRLRRSMRAALLPQRPLAAPSRRAAADRRADP